MQSASMALVAMADEEQPIFHDFLGIAGQQRRRDAVQSMHLDGMKELHHHVSSSSEKASVLRRASSMNSGRHHLEAASVVISAEQLSWPTAPPQRAHSCGGIQEINSNPSYVSSDLYHGNRHGKRKDMVATENRNHVQLQQQQQQQQKGAEEEAMTTPFPPKVRRAESGNEQRSSSSKAMEEVSVSKEESSSMMMMMMMQPPPLWASPPLPPQNLPQYNAGGGASYGGAMPPKYMSMMMMNRNLASASSMEKSSAPPSSSSPSPADEGSRTGLKTGSRTGPDLSRTGPDLTSNSHSHPTALPPPPIPRSKSLNQAAAIFSSSQPPQALSIGKQMTIFYGGQAHVFEDVSSDKLDAIMALAGSSGRSWSTTYNPRPEASASLKRTDCSTDQIMTNVVPASSLSSSPNLASSSPPLYHRQEAVGHASSLRPDSSSRGKALETGLEVVNRSWPAS